MGLGAVLTQVQGGCKRVVAYASRSLPDVEHRYSHTEKEALGLVWACERFHMYLYEVEFILLTDHKPLEVIYSTNSQFSKDRMLVPETAAIRVQSVVCMW